MPGPRNPPVSIQKFNVQTKPHHFYTTDSMDLCPRLKYLRPCRQISYSLALASPRSLSSTCPATFNHHSVNPPSNSLPAIKTPLTHIQHPTIQINRSWADHPTYQRLLIFCVLCTFPLLRFLLWRLLHTLSCRVFRRTRRLLTLTMLPDRRCTHTRCSMSAPTQIPLSYQQHVSTAPLLNLRQSSPHRRFTTTK
jgi:hypothetical protein